ncbi:MAG: enoyl-CoA hydratase/isomerase family protein [Pseudomonadota bacterium]
MSDLHIRVQDCAGWITLTRPQALNALSYEMCTAIEAAFDIWRDQPNVKVIILDAEGDRAFCSGGDISDLYAAGLRGDFAFGQRFWADEYRLNHKIFHYPKPVVSFLQGFTMGGGVGLGCHGSHRIVGESSQIAMPECGIGLVPDVGGTLMLALAPGRLGEYLGTTATRMDADDAIFSGFADAYISEIKWQKLKTALALNGEPGCIEDLQSPPPPGQLREQMDQISYYFGGETLGDILTLLRAKPCDFADDALRRLTHAAPLSAACTVEMMHRLRGPSITLEKALDLEYRFTYRASEHGDFLEGIRAAIIDKDRAPKWLYADQNVPVSAVAQMLQPLGTNALKL